MKSVNYCVNKMKLYIVPSITLKEINERARLHARADGISAANAVFGVIMAGLYSC